MKNIEYVTIPYGKDAKLRIRKDHIIATVSVPNSNRLDIYASGIDNPWHITDAEDVTYILKDIWDEWEGEE